MVTRIKAIVDWFFKRKVFYRVCNHDTNQGLWYDYEGNFTGLIHDKFSWCQNSDLKMDYDSELCGYLSAVTSITDLFKWFSKEDIVRLQEHGYSIYEYESYDYKFYDRFQHYVIKQDTLKILRRITIKL